MVNCVSLWASPKQFRWKLAKEMELRTMAEFRLSLGRLKPTDSSRRNPCLPFVRWTTNVRTKVTPLILFPKMNPDDNHSPINLR